MTGWVVVQERPAGYWPLGPAIEANFEAFSFAMRPLAGSDCGASALLLQPRHEYVCLDSEGFARCQQAFFAAQQNDPQFMAAIRRKFERLGPKFVESSAKMSAMPLESLPSPQLAGLFSEWKRGYLESYLYCEPPAFVLREPLSDFLEGQVRRKMPGRPRAQVLGAFSTLVATAEKPFATRQEEDILRIMLAIHAGGDREELLARHALEFGWIPFDYGGNEVWEPRHFRKQIADLAAQGFDAQKRLDAIDSFYSGIARKQQEVFGELGLPQRMASLFSALRDCSYLIDYKKEVYTKANLHFDAVWREAARRARIPMHTFRFVLTREATAFLEGKAVLSAGALAARETHSAIECVGPALALHEGSAAAAFFKEAGLGGRSAPGFSEVKGTCGCAGTAVGRARVVISARDIGKLQKGEVLVTMMTTPDFVVGMKKAAAIVTNEGGITCHAAIVARELGIPCVVGTGNATRAFADGDMLEVKASHGVVRKTVQLT